MTLTPPDEPIDTARQRTRDQFDLLREAHGDAIMGDVDDPADFTFICSTDHVLLASADPDIADDEDAITRLSAYLSDTRSGDFGALPPQPEQTRAGLTRRFVLPARTDPAPDGKDLLATLAEIDRDFGVGFARPDHLVHLCGKWYLCPATEPSETGSTAPWPPLNTSNPSDGSGVRVVVVDSGWYDPTQEEAPAVRSLPWSWLEGVTGEPEPDGVRKPGSLELRAYAGHGTFVAGVIRALAPACEVEVLGLIVDRSQPGGGVLESDLVDGLYDALDLDHLPDLINMSAGCPTRLNLPPQAFEDWRTFLSTERPGADVVLVAAAGNNSSPWPFWPASFDWAVGVGSLDRDGAISDFSNWGDSVDVYAPGRNLVNAFPNGTYTCHETPDVGETRIFSTWLARWSGTSFAAPVVTGLIAAALSRQEGQRSPSAARDEVITIPPYDHLEARRTAYAPPRARPSDLVRAISLNT